MYGKNDFAEISNNLTRYRFEDNFVELSNNYVGKCMRCMMSNAAKHCDISAIDQF